MSYHAMLLRSFEVLKKLTPDHVHRRPTPFDPIREETKQGQLLDVVLGMKLHQERAVF